MSTAIGYAEWERKLVNVVDNPGDTNFAADAVMAVVATDVGVIAVGVVDGIQVGTEKAHRLLTEAGVPMMVFVTKIDKERADFDKILADARNAFGGSVVPLALPIGVEAGFNGVVDLIAQEARVYSGPGQARREPVPAAMASKVQSAREMLVEKLAEQDDELIEKYFADGELSVDDLKLALGKGLKSGSVVPVLVGNPVTGAGVDLLLDIVTAYGPSPLDRAPFKLRKGEDSTAIEPKADGPFLGHVFKTIVDVHAGKITLFRVLSGSLAPDGSFVNVATGTRERFGGIFKLLGKKQEPTTNAVLGDLVAVVKLKDTRTNHTLAAEAGAGELVIDRKSVV